MTDVRQGDSRDPGRRDHGVFGAGYIEARRDAMLGDLVATMERLHRRRRIRRRLVTSAAVLALAAGSTWLIASQQTTPVTPAEDRVVTTPAESNGPIIRRVGLHRTGRIHSVDDDELIARLAEIDRPTGLIRSEGRVWLTESVVDEDLPPEES